MWRRATRAPNLAHRYERLFHRSNSVSRLGFLIASQHGVVTGYAKIVLMIKAEANVLHPVVCINPHPSTGQKLEIRLVMIRNDVFPIADCLSLSLPFVETWFEKAKTPGRIRTDCWLSTREEHTVRPLSLPLLASRSTGGLQLLGEDQQGRRCGGRATTRQKPWRYLIQFEKVKAKIILTWSFICIDRRYRTRFNANRRQNVLTKGFESTSWRVMRNSPSTARQFSRYNPAFGDDASRDFRIGTTFATTVPRIGSTFLLHPGWV